MSHSKMTKRGYSLYLEKWNPEAKKYINVCKICGHTGYSPVIDDENFCDETPNGVIKRELKRTLKKLELDVYGRCEQCAKVHGENKDG